MSGQQRSEFTFAPQGCSEPSMATTHHGRQQAHLMDLNQNQNQNQSQNQQLVALQTSSLSSTNSSASSTPASQAQSAFSPSLSVATSGSQSNQLSPNEALNLGINLEQYISKRNERERSRVRNVNDAFDNLKNSLPLDIEKLTKRMSKVEILRTAISYIRNLEDVLGYKEQQPTEQPQPHQQQQQQQQQVSDQFSQQPKAFESRGSIGYSNGSQQFNDELSSLLLAADEEATADQLAQQPSSQLVATTLPKTVSPDSSSSSYLDSHWQQYSCELPMNQQQRPHSNQLNRLYSRHQPDQEHMMQPFGEPMAHQH